MLMDEQDIKKILQIIFNNLQDKEFIWRLEGSANLKIQGVDVSVRDVNLRSTYHQSIDWWHERPSANMLTT